MRMSHMNQSRHTLECVMPRITATFICNTRILMRKGTWIYDNVSCEWVTFRIWMRQSQIWMRHAAFVCDKCIYMHNCTSIYDNVSYEWVTSHISIRHVAFICGTCVHICNCMSIYNIVPYEWVTSECVDLTYECVTPHSYVTHVFICMIAHQSMTMSHMNESRPTYECVMPHSYLGLVLNALRVCECKCVACV